MFVYHFVDLDLRVEIISRKEGTAESRWIGFEIGDVGTSTQLLEVEENFIQSLSAFLLHFW